MNDEQFNPAHYIELRNTPGQKRSAGFPSGVVAAKLIKLEKKEFIDEKNESILVIDSDSDEGELNAPSLVPSRNPLHEEWVFFFIISY